MDSMVNHYTVAKKRRRTDAYSPGGKGGMRPDRATSVYSSLIRKVYRGVPIIIGGIEASLRRLSHYDYWSDSVRRSVLLDSQADLLLYGMGERSVVEVADALNAGLDIADVTFIVNQDYFCPVLLHQLASLLTDGIRHDDDGLIASHGTDQGKTNALVAAGGFHNDGIRPDQALFLCVCNHVECSTSLNRTAHIQTLKFDQNLCAVRFCHTAQADNRRVPHCLKYIIINHAVHPLS